MSTKYHFTTHIELSTDPHDVWQTLARSERWIDWWRWLSRVDVLDEGDERGVGRRVRHQVSSPLRYQLDYVGVVTRAVEPVISRFEAEGDLEGCGQFVVEETDRGSTLLIFDWLVVTPKRWMNLLAPLARPIFVWNHHRLMEDFATDLAGALSTELIAVENESKHPGVDGFFEMPNVEL